jgi:hypothetical protein
MLFNRVALQRRRLLVAGSNLHGGLSAKVRPETVQSEVPGADVAGWEAPVGQADAEIDAVGGGNTKRLSAESQGAPERRKCLKKAGTSAFFYGRRKPRGGAATPSDPGRRMRKAVIVIAKAQNPMFCKLTSYIQNTHTFVKVYSGTGQSLGTRRPLPHPLPIASLSTPRSHPALH